MLNNAAYALAEADTEIDEAVALGLHSVAVDGRAASSTLDTVAWALYRAARYEEAHRWMVAALRLDALDTPTASRLESRDVPAAHLAAIEAALAAAVALPTESPGRGRRNREQR